MFLRKLTNLKKSLYSNTYTKITLHKFVWSLHYPYIQVVYKILCAYCPPSWCKKKKIVKMWIFLHYTTMWKIVINLLSFYKIRRIYLIIESITYNVTYYILKVYMEPLYIIIISNYTKLNNPKTIPVIFNLLLD